MLPKKYRLPPDQFPVVYKNGKKARGEYGMLIALSKESGPTPQFGFVVSKKVGGAVQRHRLTRILRVCVMECVKEISLDNCGFHFQYIAFKFCNEKAPLKTEILNQLREITNGKENSTISN